MDKIRIRIFLLGLLLFFNCFSLGTVVVLLWTLGRTVEIRDPPCAELCTPAEAVTDAGTYCDCAGTQMKRFVDTALRRITDDFMKPEPAGFTGDSDIDTWTYQPWELTPSALVEGERTIKTCQSGCAFETVKDWQRRKLSTYLRNGVELVNGRLFIPESGIYNVYSYLHIRDSSSEPKNTDMEQRLFRYNIRERKERELFRHVRPYTYPVNQNMRMYGNYMNSDVRLEAGDFIYVKVSNISELYLADCNYFGTYKL